MPGRSIRIVFLLAILAWVGTDALATRFNTTDWDDPLWVGIYPINADGSARAEEYIAHLAPTDFTPIESWFRAEAARHGRALEQPVSLRLGPVQAEHPPAPPPDGGLLATSWWSLKLRWWANRHDELANGLAPDIRLYLLYHDPEGSPTLPHSLGLQKGLVGVVHLFAAERHAGSNDVVIAHELLHTLGASDKYDLATAQPRHPDGYAEPARDPLFPQQFAEIMGGRLPLSPVESEIPASLQRVRVGPLTATEIRWRCRRSCSCSRCGWKTLRAGLRLSSSACSRGSRC